MEISDKQMIDTFNRWMEEYKRNPEGFMDLYGATPEKTYGELATEYFKSILC